MAPTSSSPVRGKWWNDKMQNDPHISFLDPKGKYVICFPCSEITGEEVWVNCNHPFTSGHWCDHSEKTKIYKNNVLQLEAWEQAQADGTGPKKKKQCTMFSAGFTGTAPVRKGFKKQKSQSPKPLTSKSFVVPPKRKFDCSGIINSIKGDSDRKRNLLHCS